MLLAGFLSLILLFGGFIYFSIFGYLHEYYFKLLEIRALSMAKIELDEDPRAAFREIHELSDIHSEKLYQEREYFFPITASANFEKEAKQLNIPVSFFETALATGDSEYSRGYHYFKGIRYESKAGRYIVVASAYDHFESRLTAHLKKTLLVALLLASIFSLLIALYYARHIFHPMSSITERVKQISSENLHLRLDLKYRNEEINELANTFNDMLNRIETSFETQNNFISNASHELRTPLTAIMGEAEVAVSKPRTAEAYRETIRIILDEAEKLEKKTSALLFLAQTGFNGMTVTFDGIRVDQLLWDVKETVEKLNSKSRVWIDTELLPENPDKLKVKGSEQLLHLALTNLISNACKYSNYLPVNVSIGASDSNIFIIIKDQGIGIPENELKYIYDPFFRASNTKKYEGYGIGLPLTRNIVKMHKGSIKVTSLLDRGTTVEVKIPSAFYN